ncbi:MAG: peptidylprolyl isomerase [Flavobacterium sp.]|nr:MAG: peptidylprolyl isomerase [Flavobacterium sp.]
MVKKLLLFSVLATLLISCHDDHANLPDGLYAEIETNKGSIIASLEFTKAPVTVANFVTLAEGKNPYANENYRGKPFFDGLTFHRVEPNFVIQGGDPDGDGSGGPGYKFKDEITSLKHSRAGTLSMANAGPGTNGSQFFITLNETPWLDGKHSVFGYVLDESMDIVSNIEVGDVMNKITIIRKGEAAKNFDAVKVFEEYVNTDEANQKRQAIIDAENKRIYDERFYALKDERVKYFEQMRAKSTKTKSGLRYVLINKGSGKKPADGKMIFIEYSGFLENGELFDTSSESIAKQYGKFDEGRAQAGMYSVLPVEAGRKTGMIPGFLEGLEKFSYGDKALLFIPAHLAYGPQGAGNVIPPNANLIFEIQLLENMPQPPSGK